MKQYKGHITKIVFSKKKKDIEPYFTKLKMYRLAIYQRINEVNRKIPGKWIREYNDLLEIIKDKKNTQDGKK